MRIISGLYKNRKINFQKLNARPTTDFAKESLFNLLKNDYIFEHTCALDLFAGTGKCPIGGLIFLVGIAV